MKAIIITEKEENQRFDKFLIKYFSGANKSFVYKMLRKKRIKLNGAKGTGGEILQKGDTIQMYIAEETQQKFKDTARFNENTPISFKKLYEDKNILVVDKPAGCLSQKAEKGNNDSLIEQVLFYLWEKGEYKPDDNFTPALCNRLDRNTSGIVIIGKTVPALQEMSKMLQTGCISKYYVTIVKGVAKKSDTLSGYLVKGESTNQVAIYENEVKNGKYILTEYTMLTSTDKFSHIEVCLKTGRPHQIRAHMQFAGFPVIGDKKYGHKGTNMTFLRKYDLNHQLLHASKITFNDIVGDYSYLNEKQICAPLPELYKDIAVDIFGGL